MRKLLLIYRLIHIKDPYKEISIGLDGRDEELCKPLLQLFYTLGATEKTLRELEETLQSFLDTKNKRKGQTLEAIIYPVVLNDVSEHGERISSTDLWRSIVESLDGEQDTNNPNIVHSSEFPTLYRNTVTSLICDKFGAEPEHTREGYILTFNPDKLRKIAKIYSSGIIKTKPIDECEQVNTVNTVNNEPLLLDERDLTNSNQKNDTDLSVHGANDVNVFTEKKKCPYCDYEEQPFFLKIHIRNSHREQSK